MDGGADEAVVGGGDIAEDEIGSNSGATTRQSASIPVKKKRYKKLGIAKSVLHYLTWLVIVNLLIQFINYADLKSFFVSSSRKSSTDSNSGPSTHENGNVAQSEE